MLSDLLSGRPPRFLLFLLLFCGIGFGGLCDAADLDASLDLDVWLDQPSDITTSIGSQFDLSATLGNASTSEGPAYQIEWRLIVPDGLSFVSSPLGIPTVTNNEITGESLLLFSTGLSLVEGDSTAVSVRLEVDGDFAAGAMLLIEALAVGGDSPYGLGEAPPGAPPQTANGGLDLSAPTEAQASTLDDAIDDAYPVFPDPWPALLVTSTNVALSLFDLDVVSQAAEGERASGTGTNSLVTKIKVTGNSVADITAISINHELPANREFLGFESVPAAASAIAEPNVPFAGCTTLRISGLTAPRSGSQDLIFRSGITEYRILDATNMWTTPFDEDPAWQGATLVLDGGPALGGGEASSESAEVVAAIYEGYPVNSSLFPATAVHSIETEFAAVQSTFSPTVVELNDTTTLTHLFEISEYLSISNPATIVATLPDGTVFGGAVTTGVSAGQEFVFESANVNANGDTSVVFSLPLGTEIPAGATGWIEYKATVDGIFEGAGNQEFEASDVLSHSVVLSATVADEGSTDPMILMTLTADDSAASITNPRPYLQTRLVSVLTADGVLYDGTGDTPVFSNDIPLPAGSELTFALVSINPRVPVLGIVLQDNLPLYAPAADVEAIRLNAFSEREDIDIFGISLPANDDDGDGFEDADWKGSTPLTEAGVFPDFPYIGEPSRVVFDLGDASPSAVFSVLMTTRIISDVPDPLPSDGLIPTVNIGVGSYVDDEGQVQETFVDSQAFTVGVPYLKVGKSIISPTGPIDAYDEVSYLIRLENTGSATAFVSSVRDSIPQFTQLVDGSVTIEDGNGNDIAADTAVVEDPQGVLSFFFDPAPGYDDVSMVSVESASSRIVEIRYRLGISASVPVGTNLDNEVTVDYLSRPDADPASNFGPIRDTATIDVQTVDVEKNLVGSIDRFAIGSTVDYTITLNFPEGESSGVVLRDAMPTGFVFVEMLSFEASTGLIFSGSSDPVVSEAGLEWNLGAVTNSDDDNETRESMTFLLRFVVANISSNSRARVLINTAFVDEASSSSSDAAQSIWVIEPRPKLTKTLVPPTADGSDVLEYELTTYLRSWYCSPAYDVVLTDVIPEFLIWSDQLTVVSGPAPTIDTSSLPIVTMTWAEIPESVLAGSPIVIRYLVEVDPLVPLGDSLVNNVTMSYTSQPGAPPLVVAGDETTSERTGDPLDPGGSVNNYQRSASAPLLIGAPTIEKLIHSGSYLQAVNDTLSYKLIVTIPEGDLEGAVIRDVLPPGLLFVEQTWSSVSPALGITLPEVEVNGQELVWDFGDFSNLDSDNSSAETINIVISVLTGNLPENQAGVTWSNAAEFEYNGRQTSTTAPMVLVIEPDLAMRITPSPSSGDGSDLVVFSVEVFNTGAEPCTAYDVVLDNTLPEYMSWLGHVVAINGPTPVVDVSGVPSSVRFSFDSIHRQYTPSNPLAFSYSMQVDSDVPIATDLGMTIEGVYSSQPGDPGLVIPSNQASGERTGDFNDPGGAANDYRMSAEGVFHVDQPLFSKTVIGGLEQTIASLVDFELTLVVPEGYRGGSPESFASLSDKLPAGLLFVEQLSASISTGVQLTGSTEAIVNGQGISWDFGNIVNTDSNNETTETIVIIYRTVVTNVDNNQDGTGLRNDAVLRFEGQYYPSSVTLEVVEPSLAVRKDFTDWVVDANEITSVRIRLYHRGNSGASAYDAVLIDVLDPSLEWMGNVVSINGPTPIVDLSNAPEIRFDLAEVDLTYDEFNAIEFGFDVRSIGVVRNPVGGRAAATIVDNTLDLTYTSIAGDPGLAIAGNEATGERSGDATGPGGDLNDYVDRDSAQLNNVVYVTFEDLRNSVEYNDFDSNDLVLELVIQETLNDQGYRQRLEFLVEAVARGAGFRHEVYLDIGAAGPVDIRRRVFDSGGNLISSSDEPANGDWLENVVVFADSMDALPAWGDGAYAFASNTDPAQTWDQRTRGYQAHITIEIDDPSLNPQVHDNPFTQHLDEFVNSLVGPWIRVKDTDEIIRQRWLHGGATQDLVTFERYPDSPLLGCPIDQTSIFSSQWLWPIEKTPIWRSYLDFPLFVLTGQTMFTDWYLSPEDSLVWPLGSEAGGRAPGTLEGADLPPGSYAFPVQLATVISSSPAIGDVDKDGDLEVVIGAYLNQIVVIGSDGTLEADIDPDPGQTMQSQASVSLGDLDDNGDLELVRGYDNGLIYLLHHDGTPFGAGPIVIGHGISMKSSVAIGDLDSDEVPELVVLGGDTRLYALHLDGSMVSGFPVDIGGTADVSNNFVILPSPAIADIEGDGSSEIIVVSNEGLVWVLGNDGIALPGWPVALQDVVLSSPALWDLDADEKLDVVIATDSGSIVAIGSNGVVLWTAERNLGGPSSPSIGDLNGDQSPEIVVGSLDGKMYAFDTDGVAVAGWPVTSQSLIQGSPALADIDGDGDDEVFFASFDTFLYGFDGDGTVLQTSGGTDFPVQLGAIVFSSPAVADVDGDTQPEIIVGCYDRNLYAIEASGMVDAGSVAWSQFRSGADHRGVSSTLDHPVVFDSLIFTDGFESGFAERWSSSVGQ